MVKQVRDCSFEDLKLFCNLHNLCRKCPFKDDIDCKISNITNLPDEILDIEIEVGLPPMNYTYSKIGYVDEESCFLNHMEEVLDFHSRKL